MRAFWLLMPIALSCACASTDFAAIERSASPTKGQHSMRGWGEGDRARAQPPAIIPDPARGGEVTLDQLLAYAHHHAPALRLARAQRALAQARLLAGRRLLPANPRIEAGFGPRVVGDGSAFDLQLSLSQEIEVAGQRGLRRRAARRYAAWVEQRVEAASWQARREIAAAFRAAAVARQRLRIALDQVAFSKQLVAAAKRRLKAGDIAPLKLKLAQVEVEQAEQGEMRARGDLERARIQLAAIAGWPSATPPLPRGDCAAPPALPPIEALLAQARSRQPALVARRAAVAEASARAEAAARAAWSNPALGLSYVREGAPTAGEGATHVALFTLGIELPLWRRNVGARAGARADLALARAELQVAGQRLEGQLRAAVSAVGVAAQRVAHYGDRILPRYRESLRLLKRAYELGEVDLLQVFVARGRLITGQQSFVEARASYCGALLELEAIVGPVAATPVEGN